MRLLPHPSSLPAIGPIGVTVEVTVRDGRLEFEYRVEGVLDRLSWPRAAPAVRTDGLWQHTCFEAFLAVPDRPAYVELNFAPSGAWAAYAFCGYRTGLRPLEPAGAPRIAFESGSVAASVHAGIDVAAVLAPFAAMPPALELALCAVIEDDSGAHSYWALCHGDGRPDFHRRDGFTLTLPVGADAPREGDEST